MVLIFSLGLLLIALSVPVATDWPALSGPETRRWFLRFGLGLSGLAIVVGEFEAGGLAALTVLVVAVIAALGLLFWLDRGRFDSNHTRRSMGWYFRECGPGGWPMGGHRVMALVVFAVLLALLLFRPLARAILGLDAQNLEAAASVLGL